MLPGREEPASPGTPLKRRSFATTHWSVVLATRDVEPDRARQALERLCATYWYPVYACVRRFGKDHAEAEDITQGFFERILSRQAFQHLEPRRPGCGRFCGSHSGITWSTSTIISIAKSEPEISTPLAGRVVRPSTLPV
jgi:hypothetical protein